MLRLDIELVKGKKKLGSRHLNHMSVKIKEITESIVTRCFCVRQVITIIVIMKEP